MSCEKIESSLLQDMLEGTIDPLEKIFMEDHVKTCRECRRELSELKLLLWELDNKESYQNDIPVELNTLGSNMIDDFLGKPKNVARKIVDVQVHSLKMSKKFLDFVPGSKQTPKILKKASKELAKGVKKLVNG